MLEGRRTCGVLRVGPRFTELCARVPPPVALLRVADRLSAAIERIDGLGPRLGGNRGDGRVWRRWSRRLGLCRSCSWRGCFPTSPGIVFGPMAGAGTLGL